MRKTLATWITGLTVWFWLPPAFGGFIDIPTPEQSPCQVRLGRADALKIPYQCVALRNPTAPIAGWESRLRFRFGRLSQQQHTALRQAYELPNNHRQPMVPGDGRPHDPDREYWLVDFLPPAVGRLEGKQFIPEERPADMNLWEAAQHPIQPGQSPSIWTYANCWGITYEVLRGTPEPVVFQARGQLMHRVLEKHSRPLDPKLHDGSEPPQLQPGDLVLISHEWQEQTFLDHTVVAIDDGVYFEKAGSGKATPIRLTQDATLRQLWNPKIFRYSYRRPKAGARWRAPHLEFSLASPNLWAEFPGLSQLPTATAKHYTADWVREDDGTLRIYFFNIQDPASSVTMPPQEKTAEDSTS